MPNKPILVILPGWGGSRETWQEFINLAGNDFEIVCINLPCFGDEPCPGIVWGVEEYADFVYNKVYKLLAPGSELILLGHSFGGQVAAYLAAKHPDLIAKLILSGPALFRQKKSLRRFMFMLAAKAGKIIFRLPIIEKFNVLAKKILYRTANSPDYSETSGIKRDIFKKIIRQDLKTILPKIKVPALLIWGDKDTYVPWQDGKRALKLIPDAKLRIIPGGKHGPHLQDPRGLYLIIREFIAN